MPGYGGTGRATLLRDNKQVYLFQRETNVTGRASIAVQFERVNRSFYPWGASFQIFFTDVNGNPADPGTFEMDVQTSDIDQDAQYCTVSTVNSGLSTSFIGRVELTSFWAKFARVRAVTVTNAVYVSVLVTR